MDKISIGTLDVAVAEDLAASGLGASDVWDCAILLKGAVLLQGSLATVVLAVVRAKISSAAVSFAYFALCLAVRRGAFRQGDLPLLWQPQCVRA